MANEVTNTLNINTDSEAYTVFGPIPSSPYAGAYDAETVADGRNVLLDESSLDGLTDFLDDPMDVMKNLVYLRKYKKPIASVPNPTDPMIAREKERIKQQYDSNDYFRDDRFGIGTVYFNIPPTSISITEQKHNYRLKTLRGESESVFSSGRSTMRIDLEIVFNGLEDINNKLRPLLAQLKCTPFLPIDSAYIRSIINPLSRGIKDDIDYAEQRLKEVEDVQNKTKALSDAIASAENKGVVVSNHLQKLCEDGVLRQVDVYNIMGALNFVTTGADPYRIREQTIISAGEAVEIGGEKAGINNRFWVKTDMGGETFDMNAYLNYVIQDQAMDKVRNDLTGPRIQGIVRDILRDSDDLLNGFTVLGKMKMEYDELLSTYASRELEDPVIGALSNISVSTDPGFPETLLCRISMNIFNYIPFVSTLMYVKGYDPEKVTPRITECDIFIDWYARRFLDENRDGYLSEYEKSAKPEFVFCRLASEQALVEAMGPAYERIIIPFDDQTVITGLSFSLANAIKFLPTLSCDNATCQYLGALNSSVSISINSTDIERVKDIRKMLDFLSKTARSGNRVGRYYSFFQLEDPLINLGGIKYLMPESFSIDTVPGNPGLYSIVINASEVKFGDQVAERLESMLWIDDKAIRDAAEYILRGSAEYMQDSDLTRKNTIGKAVYHEMLFGSKSLETMIKGRTWFGGGALKDAAFVDFQQHIFEKYGESPGMMSEWEKRALDPSFIGAVDPSIVKAAERQSLIDPDWKNKYMLYLEEVFRDSDRISEFENELPYLVDILSVYGRENLKQMLSVEDFGYRDLQSYVYDSAKKSSQRARQARAFEQHCYPDLALPRYADLGDAGEKFKLKFRDVGLLGSYPGMVDETIQDDGKMIEPDAFYYKGSIYRLLENTRLADVDVGLNCWKNIVQNSRLARQFPINSSNMLDMQEKLNQNEALDSGAGVDVDAMERAQESARNAIRAVGGFCMIQDVVAPGVYRVKPVPRSVMDPNNTGALDQIIDFAMPSFLVRDITCDPVSDNVIKIPEKGGNLNRASDHEYNISKSKLILKGRQFFVNIEEGGRMYRLQDPNFLKRKANVFKGLSYDVFPTTSVAEGGEVYEAVPGAFLVDAATSQTSGQMLTAGKVKMNNSIEKKIKNSSSMELIGAEPSKLRKKEVEDIVEKTEDGEENKGVIIKTEAEVHEPTKTLNASKLAINYNPDSANKTIYRWDRHMDDHFYEISKRVRGCNKDDKLRMVRAFPTFKFYFVDEDRRPSGGILEKFVREWRNLDDLYAYNAIISIDIHRSRKDPIDTAVVKILNTRGILDKSRYGIDDYESNNTQKGPLNNPDKRASDTLLESEEIESFVLKQGTKVRIKMGYSSDPFLLDNVFTGIVSEVSVGDVITIVAQGYGAELVQNKITGLMSGKQRISSGAPYDVLSSVLGRIEVRHFGNRMQGGVGGPRERIFGRRMAALSQRYKWLGGNEPDWEEAQRRLGPLDISGSDKYVHQSLWRKLSWAQKLMASMNDPRDDNIFTPEVDAWYKDHKGEYFDFLYANRTIWDVFQDVARSMPGYVAQVIPYDSRATVYFGPKDFYYCFSDEVSGLYNKGISYINNGSNLINDAIKAKEIRKPSTDEKIDFLNKVDAILSDAVWVDMKRANGFSETRKKSYYDDPEKFLTNVLYNMQDPYAEKVCNRKFTEEEYETIKFVQNLVANKSINGSSPVGIPKIKFGYRLGSEEYGEYVGMFDKSETAMEDWNVFLDKDGKWIHQDTWLTQKRVSLLAIPPYYKLFRSYHYKDSFKDIVSNSITASDSNMWNRVELFYGRRERESGGYKKETFGDAGRVVCQADDNIFKDKIRAKYVVEPNAKTIDQRWNYAVSHLQQGIAEMYSGHLTILGDSSIKPYDVILMNDFYTDMHGCFEVREVNHHFSHDTGFVTTIVPDCITYSHNKVEMAGDIIAGAWNDAVSSSLLGTYYWKIPFAGRITMKHVLIGALVVGASFLIRAGMKPVFGSIKQSFIEGMKGAAAETVGGASTTGGTVAAETVSASTSAASASAYTPGVAQTIMNPVPFVSRISAVYKVGGVLGAAGMMVSAVPAAYLIAGATELAVKNPLIPLIIAGGVLAERTILPTLRHQFNSMKFHLTSLTQNRREPIDILPLMYANRSYIAGLQGMRRSQWWEPAMEGLRRAQYYYGEELWHEWGRQFESAIGGKGNAINMTIK